ncbi:protein of unknown function [Methanoculleus bourgensis]|uniref:Uncharacterized protein n=1 Tax=Methanoculleus bourgensis TaxID=83986 RepID=A0A0X3BIN6_9EURY|nr:protein of unknown function [Methanoculleus bourgensis]
MHHRIRSRQRGLPRLLIFEFRVPIAALAHSGTPASREVRYPHLPVKASLEFRDPGSETRRMEGASATPLNAPQRQQVTISRRAFSQNRCRKI